LHRAQNGIRYPGLAIAILCLVAGSLLSCGVDVPTPETVTITFACREIETDFYEGLRREFEEAQPRIRVELSDLRAHNGDVFTASQFDLAGLRDRGDILSLDPFIEQGESLDLSDFYPGTVGLLSSEGETWAIPAGVDVIAMYYNQDLFDRYGVGYPEIGWTWEDFLSAALAIRDDDAGVFGYVSTPHTYGPVVFIYQHGGQLFDDLQKPTSTTFDHPLTIEAVEWYARLTYEHGVAPTPEQARVSFGWSTMDFFRAIVDDRAGMWMGMLSERRQVLQQTKLDVHWGVVPLPRDTESVTGAMVEGCVVSSETQYPKACYEWIAFLSGRVPNILVPARKSVAHSAAYDQRVGKDVALVARLCMEDAMLVSPELAGFEGALETFYAALEEVVSQRSTAEEAMNWAQSRAEQQGE